jgi:hypothetical protein
MIRGSRADGARDAVAMALLSYLQMNDAGQVVWQGWDGHDREIYLYTP